MTLNTLILFYHRQGGSVRTEGKTARSKPGMHTLVPLLSDHTDSGQQWHMHHANFAAEALSCLMKGSLKAICSKRPQNKDQRSSRNRFRRFYGYLWNLWNGHAIFKLSIRRRTTRSTIPKAAAKVLQFSNRQGKHNHKNLVGTFAICSMCKISVREQIHAPLSKLGCSFTS